MVKVFYLVLILLVIVSCRKDDIEPTNNNTNIIQPSYEEDYYYPYYEYDYSSEFIGDFAFFKGTITDTTLAQSFEGFKIRNTQGMSGQSTITNGQYLLSSVRGDVVGYYNCHYPELDTVFMEIMDENNTIINTVYLLGDTLIYNDTITYDIQL